jgi:multidrug efflux pump subunit AcrB
MIKKLLGIKPKAEKLNNWQKFGLFFYKRRGITVLIWLIAMFVGIGSYTTWMRREGFPSVNVAAGFVQVASFGSDAKTVDKDITLPLIKKAQENPSLKEVQGSSSDQGASINMSYKDGTDVAAALKTVEDYSKTILPSTAQAFFVKFEGGRITQKGDDILVSVHAKGLTPDQLDAKATAAASVLKNKLKLAERVVPIALVEKGVNPDTGEAVSGQVIFDRFYGRDTKGEVLPSALVAIRGVKNVDQLKLYDEVESALASSEFKAVGISADVSSDFAESIREQVSGLQTNLFEGLVVVLIISFILISWRASVITALAMSTTVVITVGILHLIGYTLNTITLFSLVLCLALIVDDTTIIVEAIDAGLKRGEKLNEVVRSSLKKVARASATGTFTTALAFAPMLFIGGVLGKFIRAIPVTIIISLLVSLLVSFMFIPLMMKILEGKQKPHKPRAIDMVDKFESGFGSMLARVLEWSSGTKIRSIAMRLSAVVVSLVFVVGAGMTFKKIKFDIFPAPKDGIDLSVSGRITDRENANIATTQTYTDAALDDVKQVLGKDLVELTLNGQTGSADRDGFSATVLLTPIKQRDVTSVEYAKRIQAKFDARDTGMKLEAAASGVGPPASDFAVQLKDVEGGDVRALAADMQTYMKSAQLKRPDGTTAGFKDITVTPSVQIVRDGTTKIVTVRGGFTADDTSALVSVAQDSIKKEFGETKLASYNLPKDAVEFNLGQEQENQDSFASMGKAAGPLFLAMFILIAVLFRSLLQPLLIFSALPFALYGISNGLFYTKNPISFFSMLGVFALIGISLNNTILLTDFANQAKKEGKSAPDAMALAITERLRPLLTTSITSVLALLPLALNDPFWEGLAFTLIFGLLSSTVLVLFVFPYFYLINDSISMMFKNIYGRVVKTKR